MSKEEEEQTIVPDWPTMFVTSSPQRVTLQVVQESDDYYILESDDHRIQTHRRKDDCKVEKVSFIAADGKIR